MNASKHPVIVDRCESDYKRTNNPLYAWTAYRQCRKAGAEIPQWVLEYLDWAAANLVRLSESLPEGKEVAPSIAEGLRMKRPGKSGRRTVFTEFRDLDETTGMGRKHIAATVMSRITKGYKPDQAIEYAAKRYGISKSTVRRAWKDHRPQNLPPGFWRSYSQWCRHPSFRK